MNAPEVSKTLKQIDLILGVIGYFAFIHYASQVIEVTEEGIRTSYMHQQRFIRWDEARTFASYDAYGVRKNSLVSTYELSNEQTVVRWSQKVPTSLFLFLTMESNIDKKEDWNWIVGSINSI